MKVHCFLDTEIRTVLGMAQYMFIKGERIKVKFKVLCSAKEVMPEEFPGDRINLITIDSWTLDSEVRAQDIKDELKGLGCSEYLVDENTLELKAYVLGDLNSNNKVLSETQPV